MAHLSIAKMGTRERIVAAVAVFFVFLTIMDRVVMGPILSQMQVLDLETEEKVQAISRNMRILSYRDSIIKEFNRFAAYWQNEKQSHDEIIAEHLREVETLANYSSIAISRIESGEFEETPLNIEFGVSLDCEGTLGNMLQFMKFITDSNLIFRIDKYMMAPKSKGSDIIKATIFLTRILVMAEEIPSADEGS